MTVYFAEGGAHEGGSGISLFYLVRGFVAAGHRVIVNLVWPGPWTGLMQQAGAEVEHRWPDAPPPAPATSAAPRRPRGLTSSPAYQALSFYWRDWRGRRAAVNEWAARLERARPDLVYPNNGLPLNFDLALAADRLGLPLVCHLRGLQPIRWPHRRFAPRLPAGIAISEFVRQHYLRAGFSPGQIHRVHNGIDVADYPWREPDPAPPADGGRLLFLGRLVAWKGAILLLEALARVRRERPRIELTVAGAGDVGPEMNRRIRELGLEGSVRTVGFQRDIGPLLAGADLLVHASTEPEPFGRVLLEGMAAGVPVVASRLGATTEIIEDGVTGRLAAPGNSAELAAAILELLGAGSGRVAMARRARERVEREFTIDATLAGVLRTIDGVMARRGAGRPRTPAAGSGGGDS